MLSLPLPPRLSRFMLAACCQGIPHVASIAAAVLTERDPFRGSSLLIAERAEKLKDFENKRATVDDAIAAKNVLRVARQIRKQLPTHLEAGAPRIPSERAASHDNLAKALLTAYPDRLAKRRENDSLTGVMVGGRGVKFDKSIALSDGDLQLCLDVDSAGTEAKVRMAIAIQDDWLPEDWITQIDEPMFDASLQSVVARRRRRFDDLLLTDSPIKCEPSKRVAQILAEAARVDIDRILADVSKDLVRWIDRVRFVTSAMPELELPPVDAQAIDSVLLLLCQTRTKIAQLQQAPWLDHLRSRFSYQQSQLINQHAPARFALPSGNSAAVIYDDGKPRMEVRIQELFGLPSTPRIAGGRVPITLHLLGPNYRPQQITDDLENFWNETYAHVRKELRGRYPKHHWPEDPTTATATPKGLKPKPN
jgi:ATP-dependent helicase HrpB